MCFPVSFSSLVCPLASRLSCTNTLLCTRNLTLSTFVRRLALPMTMEMRIPQTIRYIAGKNGTVVEIFRVLVQC
ncbi:hypothetical protein KCU68_g126, partial [Aureobasidium melanogenum]